MNKTNLLTTSITKDVYDRFQLLKQQVRMNEGELLRHITRCGVWDNKETTPYYSFDIPILDDKPKPHKIQTSLCLDDYKDFLILCMDKKCSKTEMLRRIVSVVVIDTDTLEGEGENHFNYDIDTLEEMVVKVSQ